MLVLLAAAFASDPLHDCTVATIARASPRVQDEIHQWGNLFRSLDEQEAALDVGSFDEEARLVQAAMRAGDREQASRVAARLAAEVRALAADDDVHRYRGKLAQAVASAAIGDKDAAAKHLRAARAIPDTPTTQQLLVAMAVVGEPRDTLEQAFLAESGDSFDVLEAMISLSRALGYAGAGRAVLTADLAGRARKLPLGDAQSSLRAHDEVLEAAIEGARAVEDWGLVADLMLQMADAGWMLKHFQDVAFGAPTDPRLKGWVDAALAREPEADDFPRFMFVYALANVGYAREAAAVAAHVEDPAMRANAEAQAARGLVMVDRDAGLALARSAKARLDATAPDRYNQADLSAARTAIESTEARGGGVAGAGATVYDVAFGLVASPDRRVAWWSALGADDRARVVAAADDGGWPESLFDRAVWAELCAGR